MQTVGQGDRASVLIRSEPLNASQIVTLRQALFDRFQPIGSGGQPSWLLFSQRARRRLAADARFTKRPAPRVTAATGAAGRRSPLTTRSSRPT